MGHKYEGDVMTRAVPTVSVILPCYNAHKFLAQTIDSVRNQTFRDTEIIVINDGSTNPETLAFLDALDSDINVVHQENRGLPGARNTGFRHARGTYVLPLDCDDWLEPTHIEKMLQALEQNPDAAFAFCYFQLESEARGVLKKQFNFFEQLFNNQLPYCLLMKKSTWLYTGGYDETMRQGYEDWEFNIRLGGMGMFGVLVKEPLFHYRVLKSGMLMSLSEKFHTKLWRAIRARNVTLYKFSYLFRVWCIWRSRPSTYPLGLYFLWLAINKVTPTRLIDLTFKTLRQFSHSRRVTRKTREA